jgi:hypothetical protein
VGLVGGGVAGIIREEDVSWILIGRRQKKNALATLRQTECFGVHDSVCPLVSELLQCRDDDLQRPPAGKLKHERDVLEQHERDSVVAQQPKDFGDQP